MSDRSVENRSSRVAQSDSSARDSTKKSRRGGRRKGAGRKPGRFRKPAHRARPPLSPRHPVHVTYRLEPYVRVLRDRDLYHVFRRVLACYLERPGFRIVHISIQTNHLHLIVEAADREALTSGLQSFAIRCAIGLHDKCGTTGKVFTFRYHSTQITTPRQAHNSVTYVLNNWRRHHLDLTPTGIHWCPVDPYSSGVTFTGWSKRIEVRLPAGYVPLPVSPPQTELLRRVIMVDPFAYPGPRY